MISYSILSTCLFRCLYRFKIFCWIIFVYHHHHKKLKTWTKSSIPNNIWLNYHVQEKEMKHELVSNDIYAVLLLHKNIFVYIIETEDEKYLLRFEMNEIVLINYFSQCDMSFSSEITFDPINQVSSLISINLNIIFEYSYFIFLSNSWYKWWFCAIKSHQLWNDEYE